jgi:hypothetical protein
MTDATAAVSPLRRRMIDDMSLRNLSPATQRSYLHAVKRFSQFHGRSPDRLGLEDVRAFQVYLVSQGIGVATTGVGTLRHPKPVASTRRSNTNPIARGRVSGLAQSGFNEVAQRQARRSPPRDLTEPSRFPWRSNCVGVDGSQRHRNVPD